MICGHVNRGVSETCPVRRVTQPHLHLYLVLKLIASPVYPQAFLASWMPLQLGAGAANVSALEALSQPSQRLLSPNSKLLACSHPICALLSKRIDLGCQLSTVAL
jgi:hypothetical protein